MKKNYVSNKLYFHVNETSSNDQHDMISNLIINQKYQMKFLCKSIEHELIRCMIYENRKRKQTEEQVNASVFIFGIILFMIRSNAFPIVSIILFPFAFYK